MPFALAVFWRGGGVEVWCLFICLRYAESFLKVMSD